MYAIRSYYDAELQAVAEGDDRAGDGRVVAVVRDVVDEGAIDLELLDGQPLEVAEGRITSYNVCYTKLLRS